MRFKRTLSAILAAGILAGLAGCGEKKERIDTLVWYIPSSELTDKASVEAEINKIIEPEIGAKMEFKTIDTGSYGEKMRMKLAAGDGDFDIFFTGYLSPYDQNVKNEVLEPLTRLIDENCPELWKAIPDYIWEDAKYNGEIYAVPNEQVMATQYCYGIQTKLAEKYGWTKEQIEAPEELEEFLAKVKEGEPDIYPYRTNYGTSMWLTGYESVAGGMYLKKGDSSDRVLSLYDIPEFKQAADTLREWYEKGYIRNDVASVGDDNTDYQAGKYAVNSHTWKPGMGLQFPDYTFVKVGKAFMSKGAAKATMTGINHKSKNKEKAIKLISLMNTNKELFNLASIGIKDKHYTLNEDGKYKAIEKSGYGVAAWMLGNQFNALVNINQDNDVWDQTKMMNDEAEKSKLGSFTFDDSNVKVELSAVSAVTGPYTALGNGSQDPKSYWDEMINNVNKSGIDKIKTEVQAQLDAYLQGK